jgi:hypothetical protein
LGRNRDFDTESLRQSNLVNLVDCRRFCLATIANRRATPVDQLIPWLLDEETQLRGIPFGEVIADVSGKKSCRSTRTAKSIS